MEEVCVAALETFVWSNDPVGWCLDLYRLEAKLRSLTARDIGAGVPFDNQRDTAW